MPAFFHFKLKSLFDNKVIIRRKARSYFRLSVVDAKAERRDKIAGLFCKAFERAVLLTPTEENVRLWVEGTRMRPDEIEDSIKESYELAQTFQTIGDLLKNEILPKDQQINGQ